MKECIVQLPKTTPPASQKEITEESDVMPCWYYDKNKLRDTPSIRDGIPYESERRYRKEGARFIMTCGTQMGLGHNTIATGVVYFHRFYMFHSFRSFPRYVTACCSLLLAGKVEETPKKCRDIIRTARTLLSDNYFFSFGEDPKEEVMTLERILLQTIKFDLQVDHPYTFLLKYAKCLKGDQQKLQKMVQMAWNFVNDSLSTVVCLQWEPEIIAVALIHLASKLSRFNVVDWIGRESHHIRWWDMFVADVTMDILEDICHQVLDLYQTNQTDAEDGSQSPPQKPPSRADSPTRSRPNNNTNNNNNTKTNNSVANKGSIISGTGTYIAAPRSKATTSTVTSTTVPHHQRHNKGNSTTTKELNNIQSIKSLAHPTIAAAPPLPQDPMTSATALASASYHMYPPPPPVSTHHQTQHHHTAPLPSHHHQQYHHSLYGSTAQPAAPPLPPSTHTANVPAMPPPLPMAPYGNNTWPPQHDVPNTHYSGMQLPMPPPPNMAGNMCPPPPPPLHHHSSRRSAQPQQTGGYHAYHRSHSSASSSSSSSANSSYRRHHHHRY